LITNLQTNIQTYSGLFH